MSVVYSFELEYLLSIKIETLKKGGCLATRDDLPEFLAQGRTVAETLEIAQDVARKIVESYLDHGDPPGCTENRHACRRCSLKPTSPYRLRLGCR